MPKRFFVIFAFKEPDRLIICSSKEKAKAQESIRQRKEDLHIKIYYNVVIKPM